MAKQAIPERVRKKVVAMRVAAAGNGAFLARLDRADVEPPALRDAVAQLEAYVQQSSPRWSRLWLKTRAGWVSWWSINGVQSRAAAVIEAALAVGNDRVAESWIDAWRAADPGSQRAGDLKAGILAARGEFDAARRARQRTRPKSSANRASIEGDLARDRARRQVRALLHALPSDTAAISDDAPGAIFYRAALDNLGSIDRSGQFDAAVARFLAASLVADLGTGLGPVIQAFGRRVGGPTPILATPELAESIRWADMGALRSLVADRSVAIVGNGSSLVDAGLGQSIDEHDVIVRVDDYTVVPVDNGSRTDVHIAHHDCEDSFGSEAGVRVLVAGARDAWLRSVAVRIQPRRQSLVGDDIVRESLASLVGPDGTAPTTMFRAIRFVQGLRPARIGLFGVDPDPTRGGAQERDTDRSSSMSEGEASWVVANAWDGVSTRPMSLHAVDDGVVPDIANQDVGCELDPGARSRVAPSDEAILDDAERLLGQHAPQEALNLIGSLLADHWGLITDERSVQLMARALEGLGCGDAAIEALGLVQYPDQRMSRAQTHIARIALEEGRRERGLVAANYALRLDPTNSAARALLWQLRGEQEEQPALKRCLGWARSTEARSRALLLSEEDSMHRIDRGSCM